MDDLIYRQDAIDAAEKESQVDGAYGYMDTKSIVDLLNDLPSAERKKGRWILTRNMWCCSECASIAPYYYMSGRQKTSNYCYVCGAKMENIDQQG